MVENVEKFQKNRFLVKISNNRFLIENVEKLRKKQFLVKNVERVDVKSKRSKKVKKIEFGKKKSKRSIFGLIILNRFPKKVFSKFFSKIFFFCHLRHKMVQSKKKISTGIFFEINFFGLKYVLKHSESIPKNFFSKIFTFMLFSKKNG